MSFRFRRLAAGLALVLASSAAAACSAEPPPPPRDTPGALAIVVGARNNMPKPELPVDLLDTVVEDAIRSEDTLYVVEVSGEPRQTFAESMASNCDSEDACDSVVRGKLSLIAEEIANVRAGVPEADTLGAIAVAARATSAGRGLRQIIVIDNGLQTAGAFRLQTPRAMFTDPEVLAQALRDDNRLPPELVGAEIIWVGLASATPPQENVDEGPRAALRALWESILTEAGATVTFVGGLPDGAPPAHPDLPPVTPVGDVVDEPIVLDDPCPTIFDDQVGFVPNEAEFRDEARARSVLVPIAEGLIAGDRSAQLIGYVALPERPGPQPLSLRRAEAVRDLLVDLGVPTSLLTPVGGGLAPDASGSSESPEALAQYRRVEVISAACGSGDTQ